MKNIKNYIMESHKGWEFFKSVTDPSTAGINLPGLESNDVKWLQWELNESGFNCGKVDGIFGTNTEKATIKFKKKYKYTTPTGGTTSTAIHNKLKTLH